VQLESHATPPRETPQQRYANLHRAIERGLDSDEVWRELAEVSASIGHGDEAVRCVRHVRNEAVRYTLESRLIRLGLMSERARSHPAAPAASGAGPGAHDTQHGLRDHVVDAFQYLFHQQMPWLVLLTTLAFPLVVGVGGFLTAGGSPLLLTAIAAMPGLCVVALVGAMGRQILLTSAEGTGDVPAIPGFAELVVDARRFFVDAGLVLGALLGPSLVAIWLGAPLTTTLPALAIGGYFAPMAWSLRHLNGTLHALSPVKLLRAVTRGGASYAGIAAVACTLFAPGAAVGFLTLGRPVWVQIAIVGPLCVVPLYIVSRLLGTWLDSNRHVVRQGNQAQRAAAAAALAAAASPDGAVRADSDNAARRPRRPDGLQRFQAPVARQARKRPAAAAPAAPQQVAQRAPARPAMRAAAPRAAAAPAAPAARPAVAPAPAPTGAPAKPAPRAIEGRVPSARPADSTRAATAATAATPSTPVGPGAPPHAGRTVVSGRERQRMGAAAKRP
jgi:hypothetical protein